MSVRIDLEATSAVAALTRRVGITLWRVRDELTDGLESVLASEIVPGPRVAELSGRAGPAMAALAAMAGELEADAARIDDAVRRVGAVDDTFGGIWNRAVDRVARLAATEAYEVAADAHELYTIARDPAGFLRRRLGPPSPLPGTGDRGGTYEVRATGPTGAVRPGRAPDRGRESVVRFVTMTGDVDRIRADEFGVVDHGHDRFTIILPGVTDLSAPEVGLDRHHRSVRDLDRAALSSAFDVTIDRNPYAQMVQAGLRAAGVPAGSRLLIVGHSFGSDTALDLASDPSFNGARYRVTHVVAAGYHSEPQLHHVGTSTEVLVLQNVWDLVVAFESLPDRFKFDDRRVASSRGDDSASTVHREFEGGLSGAGHSQGHYAHYLASTADDGVAAFFESVDEAGYTAGGAGWAIDVSVPDRGRQGWKWARTVSPASSIIANRSSGGIPP